MRYYILNFLARALIDVLSFGGRALASRCKGRRINSVSCIVV
jgi:hypothetical protein